MPGSLIDSNLFTFADGNGGHVVDLGSAPSVGQWDVLCVNSNTTVSTPAGFTAEESAVTNQGAYIFSREAAGGEGQTVVITTSGDHNTFVGWQRWGNFDATDTTTSTQANGSSGNSTPAHSTGTLSASNEVSIAFGALHSIGTANQNTPVWSSGYDTGLLAGIQGSGATGVVGYVAAKIGAGTAAETPSVSWSGDGAQNRYMLVITLTTTGGEVAVTAAADFGALAGAATAARTVAATGTAALDALSASVADVAATTGVAVLRPGGWQSLLDVIDAGRQAYQSEIAAGPQSCPNDGEPLRATSDGGLFCPFDGWRPR